MTTNTTNNQEPGKEWVEPTWANKPDEEPYKGPLRLPLRAVDPHDGYCGQFGCNPNGCDGCQPTGTRTLEDAAGEPLELSFDDCGDGRMPKDWAETIVLRVNNYDRLTKENEALRKVMEAAEGLSYGVDWNNGTHAKEYRPKLLAALSEAKALLNTDTGVGR